MSDEQQEHPRPQEYVSLVEANNAAINKLATEGVQVNPESVAAERLNFYIERMLAAMDVDDRIDFEIAFQERVAKILKKTGQHARMQRLQARGHRFKNGGLIVPPSGRE